jgi:predicted DNA-binding protein
MKKISVPDRKYSKEPKSMVSWRLPGDLLKKLNKISKKKGYTTTELVRSVLDQFCQQIDDEN